MNLLLLYETDRDGDRFVIRGPRLSHLKSVLGAEAGKTLRVGLLGGPLGTAAVEVIDEARAILVATFGERPEPPLDDLVLAVPRPKSLKKLLPELAALGVDRLFLCRTWKVERAYLGSPLLTPQGYEPLLDEGLMQGMSTLRPQISVEPLFKPFAVDRLPGLIAGRRALVLDPRAPARLADIGLGPKEPTTIAVGPEGGFLPYEVELLAAAGFSPVRMGSRILRVETACVAALAQLDLLRQQADGICGAPARR